MKKRNLCLVLAVLFCFTLLLGISASAASDPRSVRPVVTEMSVKAYSGGRMLFSVKTDGNPYPLFQWKTLSDDGEIIDIPGANGSVMMLKGFTPGKDYEFQVHVTTRWNPAVSVSKWVKVTAE